ncbi:MULTISPECIES: tRNA uridine 5-oxyacetic acid(34) methyltransferase CmoM [Vibrio]|uniref:tRNA 5-carboxymethoxyuridine methyltransferase n=1 Tax=Vibrio casei TaxID=673372 RepID=A0A368LNK2_9VIBR|nr:MULTISPECIES: tRNA uridine 5-oxyacetic acid(34) methyltransferase CmoM [Vibrio]RCS73381.1 tRNA uridine 5-oxyacetic acid(34) methyltransferase CmoM [Vibrio casei]SJN17421.1 S-adenosylmethionine-dependent methyltransferase Functionally Coupled to the MukBEF Chromosome Partitioning Mechanism [Vibrio casei]HBV75858.1 tRNA uridine 5-oxyacetic acid(34) methyltransferase CmoM [Vibrio sp.]
MKQDRNFDDIAHKFAKNIYGSDKGDIRQTIVWQDLKQALLMFDTQSSALTILDAGGGLGQMSQKLAQCGHQIVFCDLSREMLELAKQGVEQQGLSDQFCFIHSSIQHLDQKFNEPVDLALFHAVMEWLDDPQAVLKCVLNKLKPGGIASVMFYNHHGLVLKNVTCGNIPHVLQGMPHRKRFKLQPQQGLLPDDVYQWIEREGFQICGKSGIRCFNDYIGNQQYMGDYDADDVMALEQQLCRTEPYLSLGRYIHVWAQKPHTNI